MQKNILLQFTKMLFKQNNYSNLYVKADDQKLGQIAFRRILKPQREIGKERGLGKKFQLTHKVHEPVVSSLNQN